MNKVYYDITKPTRFIVAWEREDAPDYVVKKHPVWHTLSQDYLFAQEIDTNKIFIASRKYLSRWYREVDPTIEQKEILKCLELLYG